MTDTNETPTAGGPTGGPGPDRGPWGLRLAARLVPHGARAAWLREWRGEWAEARSTRRSGVGLWLGMVADAWAVRRRAERNGGSRTGIASPGRASGSSLRDGVEAHLRAARSLVRAPGFSLPAIVTLSLGLGAVAAVGTVVDAVLLRPLPYPDEDRVMRVLHVMERGSTNPLAAVTQQFFEDENRTFEAFGGHWDPGFATLSGDGDAERILSVRVTQGLFDVLGARPVLGRLVDEEDGALGNESPVVISHGLWARRFGSDPQVVGRIIQLDGRSREVAGVMAEGVELPRRSIDLWLPYAVPTGARLDDSFRIYAMGRLAPDVEVEQATQDLVALTARLADMAPIYRILRDEYGLSTTIQPIRQEVLGDVERPLWVVLGAVGIVLLVALANVATLFLVRAERRAGEIATRRALGADRRRVLGHFLAESVWVTVGSTVLGLALAAGALKVFVAVAPTTLPRLADIGVGWATVGWSAALALATAAVLAIYPFVRFTRSRPPSWAARATGRTTASIGGGFVVAQVALALPLLVGSVLLLETFRKMTAEDPGFDARGIVVASMSLPEPFYPDGAAVDEFRTRLMEGLAGQPGVIGAALGPTPITSRGCNGLYVQGMVLADGELPPCVPVAFVGPGYFELLGNRILTGRAVEDADMAGPPVAVITANVSDRIWGAEDPLLKAVHPAPRQGPPWFPVVGVAEPILGGGPTQPASETLYLPIGAMDPDGWFSRWVDVLVKAPDGQAAAAAAAVRNVVREIDPGVPVSLPGTL
ncbi:MAG: FtsX-like permease family protein, partial [Gemmatimonadetes bacterium]|nr:FtsX-like permease family protein [Gemmatimonadota bacterium]